MSFAPKPGAAPLVRLESVERTFITGSRHVRAVAGVDMNVAHSEAVGLIGESGSGKSTIGRLLLGLERVDEGSISIDGVDMMAADQMTLRNLRSRIGVVFQEPFEALNPRMSVRQIVAEPVAIHRKGREAQALVAQALERAGLDGDLMDRYPKQLSGGQQQRVGIARAVVLEPQLLVLDEPTASLDMSVRARVLETIDDLRHKLDLSILLISHDIGSVRRMTDRLLVMYRGQIVESGPTLEVLDSPRHPYTRALMDSALYADPTRPPGDFRLIGDIPSQSVTPPGCYLAGRCPLEIDPCSQAPVELDRLSGRSVRCIRATELNDVDFEQVSSG